MENAAATAIESNPANLQSSPIMTVSSRITFRDKLGSWGSRWGINRMRFSVAPGLYRLGKPTPDSPVFVTANYKMTFDLLQGFACGNGLVDPGPRYEGNQRLVRRRQRHIRHDGIGGPHLLHGTGQGRLASQAHPPPARGERRHGPHGQEVHRLFRDLGPVEARDIPAFMANGMKATPAMREKRFPMKDRLVLTPIEIVQSWKIFLPARGGRRRRSSALRPSFYADRIPSRLDPLRPGDPRRKFLCAPASALHPVPLLRSERRDPGRAVRRRLRASRRHRALDGRGICAPYRSRRLLPGHEFSPERRPSPT